MLFRSEALKISEDMIAFLEKGQVQDAVEYLKRNAMMIGSSLKTDRPMMELTDYAARLALIRDKQQNPQRYMGLKTGFPTFDRYTGGLFPGELTLIAGVTGLGKSTMCRALGKGLTTLNGCKNILHICNEEYLEQVQYKYDALFTEIPYHDFKLAQITDENLDIWQKFMQERMKNANIGQVFIKEVPAFTDVSLVEQQFRILENRGVEIHAIIIDHLPHVKPIQQSWGENDERAKAAGDCKELARQLRVPVVTPTQAATEVEKKQAAGKRASKMDVYGSKGQVHVANTFLIITYRGTDDTQTDLPDYLRDVFWFCDAKKNRDGAPFYFNAKHYVKIGKVEEIKDPSLKDEKVMDIGLDKALLDVNKLDKSIQDDKGSKDVCLPIEDTTKTVEAHPELNTGIRDASMEFASSLEVLSPENDDVVGSPIASEEAGELLKEFNHVTKSDTVAVAVPRKMTPLEKIRANVKIPGV